MANDKRVISTIFRYEVDPSSASKVKQENQKITLTFEELGKRFKERGFLTDQELDASRELTENELKRLQLLEQQSNELRAQAKFMKLESRVLKEQAGDIEKFAKPLAAMGGLLVGGILAQATSYISKTKEINSLTEQWHANSLMIERSQERVGKVAAQTMLPYYTKLANLAEKIANFIEKNPEVMEAGLKLGVTASLLGAIGLAVAKGIRLVADAKMQEAANKMLLAAQLMNGAADKNLVASGGSKGGGLLGIAKKYLPAAAVAAAPEVAAGAAIGAAASLALTLIGIIELRLTAGVRKALGLENVVPGIAKSVGNVFGALARLDPKEIERKSTIFSALIARLTGDIDKNSELWKKASSLVKSAGGDIEDALSALGKSEHAKEIVDAYMEMRSNEAKILQDSAKQKAKIIEDAEKRQVEIVAQYQGRLQQIAAQASAQIASLSKSYHQAEKEALQNYQTQRSDIVRDGGLEIQRIEQDNQKALQKLAEEHNARMGDLIDQRDALGLVKEQRAFEDQRKELQQSATAEIKQRRADIALRLSDLQRGYAQEHDQRLAQYQQQVAEVTAQRAAAIREAAIQYNLEQKQLREAKATALRDLAEATKNELAHNRQAFIAKVRDLDASLLGEQKLKQDYYQKMLKDADAFLAAYRAKMPTSMAIVSAVAGAGVAPGKSSGGYTSGLVMTGERGREFILTDETTRLAERLLGHDLSQSDLISLILKGRNTSVTLNDNRRFEANPSAADRRAMAAATREVLEGVLR